MRPKVSPKAQTDTLFANASKYEDEGNLRMAFRLYLAGAKAGDGGCQINVGNFFDDGKGVRRNRSKALYWYLRAYRRGVSSAAHNIGIVWRKEGKQRRALSWFQKAVRLGDAESNLEIAKHYLISGVNPEKAIPFLRKVCKSKWVSEAGIEEATDLLKQAKAKLKSA
jgi:TPR repeat protein